MSSRPVYFYTEYVLVTVFSLIAATLWIEFTKDLWGRMNKSNRLLQLLVAVIVTVLVIAALYFMCSKHSQLSKKFPSAKDINKDPLPESEAPEGVAASSF